MNYINDIELGNYIDKMDFYLNEEKKYKCYAIRMKVR